MSKSATHFSISDGKKTKNFTSINSAAKEYGISNCAITNALKKNNSTIARRSDKKKFFLGEPKPESALSREIDFASLPMDETWFDKFKIAVADANEFSRMIANKLFADEDVEIDWKKKEIKYNGERADFFQILSIICRVIHQINMDATIAEIEKIMVTKKNPMKRILFVASLKKNERTFHMDVFNKIKKFK